MKYYYTYKLPLRPSTKFHYWRVENSDECIGKAFRKYKTVDFHIEEIDREAYDKGKGITQREATIRQLQDVAEVADKMGCCYAFDIIRDIIIKAKQKELIFVDI